MVHIPVDSCYRDAYLAGAFRNLVEYIPKSVGEFICVHLENGITLESFELDIINSHSRFVVEDKWLWAIDGDIQNIQDVKSIQDSHSNKVHYYTARVPQGKYKHLSDISRLVGIGRTYNYEGEFTGYEIERREGTKIES